jgi:hypothetical protein
MNNIWRNAFMRVFALKKLLSKFKAHITTCAIPGKTFISLPFYGRDFSFCGDLAKAPWEALNGFTTRHCEHCLVQNLELNIRFPVS